MAPPSDTTVIELSSTTVALIKVAGWLLLALCALISWLAVRMWQGARELAKKTEELEQIPKIQAAQKRLGEAVFGVVTEEEIVRPGTLRRLSLAEERLADLYKLLDVDNQDVKRAAIARRLGLPTADVDHGGNTFSGVRDRSSDTGRHRVFVMPPPPDADEGDR